MTASASNPFWQMIDGVFVINLEQRRDRWEQFQQNVQGIIPPEKLQRLPARWGRDIPGFGQRPWFRGGKRDGTWAARAGCTLSHRAALENARKAGWETVLIFEDDVAFAPTFSPLLPAVGRVLAQHDWQVCYLGFTDPLSPVARLAALDDRHSIYRIYGCATGHAYIVRAAARDWILDQFPTEATVWPWVARHRVSDRWYQRHLGAKFPVVCVSPGLVYQEAGYSDIVQREADYRRQGEHQLEVPASSTGAIASLQYGWRRVAVTAGLLRDVVRGWQRRLQGF